MLLWKACTLSQYILTKSCHRLATMIDEGVSIWSNQLSISHSSAFIKSIKIITLIAKTLTVTSTKKKNQENQYRNNENKLMIDLTFYFLFLQRIVIELRDYQSTTDHHSYHKQFYIIQVWTSGAVTKISTYFLTC